MMGDQPEFLDLTSGQAETESTPVAAAVEPLETTTTPPVTFRGNSYDVMALVSVTIGGVMLLSCVTCNLAYYVFPFVPIILGIVGLVLAKDSVNPERTTLLSWLSLGSGAIFFLVAFLCVAAYIGFIFFAFAMDGSGF